MQTLTEARESRGIKQKAVAEAIGVTRQTYARYEAEPQQMTIQQARAVCDFIGCDFDSVFFGEKVSKT